MSLHQDGNKFVFTDGTASVDRADLEWLWQIADEDFDAQVEAFTMSAFRTDDELESLHEKASMLARLDALLGYEPGDRMAELAKELARELAAAITEE